MTLLDYLFSQQDRIGNIDYLPHWVWVEDGQVRQLPATGGKPPAEIAARSPNSSSAPSWATTMPACA